MKFGDIGRIDSGVGAQATFMALTDKRVYILADTDLNQQWVGKDYTLEYLAGDEPIEWLDRADKMV